MDFEDFWDLPRILGQIWISAGDQTGKEKPGIEAVITAEIIAAAGINAADISGKTENYEA